MNITKRRKNTTTRLNYNYDINYRLPMMPSTNSQTDFHEDLVEAKVTPDNKGFVVVKADEYQDKCFVDHYFEYLVDIGYAKRCI